MSRAVSDETALIVGPNHGRRVAGAMSANAATRAARDVSNHASRSAAGI
ncbi:Uncharacterised protein [Mycobacteroides abscessus subsp. abscessus]|nr:Uncharacterised protein [Mycobacteroides abscessus subsp. abscessus]